MQKLTYFISFFYLLTGIVALKGADQQSGSSGLSIVNNTKYVISLDKETYYLENDKSIGSINYAGRLLIQPYTSINLGKMLKKLRGGQGTSIEFSSPLLNEHFTVEGGKDSKSTFNLTAFIGNKKVTVYSHVKWEEDHYAVYLSQKAL